MPHAGHPRRDGADMPYAHGGDPRRADQRRHTGTFLAPIRAACRPRWTTPISPTGANHPAAYKLTHCHIPQGEIDFDASILGAHAALMIQLAFRTGGDIMNVQNGIAGKVGRRWCRLRFKITTVAGYPCPPFFSSTMAGPTTDYGYTSFESGVTTPGYGPRAPPPKASRSWQRQLHVHTFTILLLRLRPAPMRSVLKRGAQKSSSPGAPSNKRFSMGPPTKLFTFR